MQTLGCFGTGTRLTLVVSWPRVSFLSSWNYVASFWNNPRSNHPDVSNVIPSIIIFSSGIPELWTPHTYTRSRRREKTEFGISRMYISIMLIYLEGFHENVENVRKSKKNRINFWKMWIWEILKIVFWRFFRSYGPASSDLCVCWEW